MRIIKDIPGKANPKGNAKPVQNWAEAQATAKKVPEKPKTSHRQIQRKITRKTNQLRKTMEDAFKVGSNGRSSVYSQDSGLRTRIGIHTKRER